MAIEKIMMDKYVRCFLTVLLSFLLISAFSPGRGSAVQSGETAYLSLIQSTPKPFTFVSWSDTKNGTAALATLSRQAKALKPAFTIYPGDLEPSGFSGAQITNWKTALNGNANNGMFDITLPVRGNHDEANTPGWQSYFDMARTSIRIGAANFSVLATDLTYTFSYGNSVFIGIDVLGPATLLKPEQLTYLDQVLTDSEKRGLTHAFLYFHGPAYATGEYATCKTRTCPAPPRVADLISILNKHPIVSAIFNGHEHVQAYVHLDSTRMPEIKHPFEEFISGSAGSGPDACDKPYRFDYCGQFYGFMTILVQGNTFTVKVYQKDQAAPVKAFLIRKP